MEIVESYAILGSVLSIAAALLSIIVLCYSRKKIREYKRSLDNLISPQREYVEKKLYGPSSVLVSDPDFLTEANGIILTSEPDKEMIIRTKLPDYSFFEDMGIILSEVKVLEKTAMCLMPFNHRFDKTKAIIAESCSLAGYKFRRSDDELLADNTNLRKTIVRMILEAEVIIAVLDGRNPNVFYEIGIAHSMGKLVLLVVNLSRDGNRWPEVDLLSNRLITYNNPDELINKLVNTLNAIHSDERGEEKANN